MNSLELITFGWGQYNLQEESKLMDDDKLRRRPQHMFDKVWWLYSVPIKHLNLLHSCWNILLSPISDRDNSQCLSINIMSPFIHWAFWRFVRTLRFNVRYLLCIVMGRQIEVNNWILFLDNIEWKLHYQQPLVSRYQVSTNWLNDTSCQKDFTNLLKVIPNQFE